jgi:hypothetical protein
MAAVQPDGPDPTITTSLSSIIAFFPLLLHDALLDKLLPALVKDNITNTTFNIHMASFYNFLVSDVNRVHFATMAEIKTNRRFPVV